MKLIKLAGISIVLLFLLVTGISLLMPSTVLVSRAINVAAPKDSILSYVNNVQQWTNWIEGMKNPEVKIYDSIYADLAGTIVNITKITDSGIISTWRSKNGNEQTATFHLITAPTQNLTIVQWQFEQKLHWYPWEKFGSIMNDKILGTMMEKNLNNLKLMVENK
jgi:hypothetical protein